MASDARKGKAYTKYARLIEIAAREGGGDPVKNAKLRGLIDAAKAESVPNANIDRAIKKGTGELKGDVMQEVTYEAYGPSGCAFIIEALTDNKNRTLSNVKLILSKTGGRFAESGSVLWMFNHAGVVTGTRPAEGPLPEAEELELIELGAEDIALDGQGIRVQCAAAAWGAIRDALKKSGCTIDTAGLQYVPKQTAPVDAVTMDKVAAIIDALDEDDDVSEVHTNAELSA